MRASPRALVGSLLLASVLVPSLAQAASDDAYGRWAASHFGLVVTADVTKQASVWGENADPDGDGLGNLIEYTADTDPNQWTAASECFRHEITVGTPVQQHQQLTAWLRTDDPELRVMCQVAPDLSNWVPALPTDPNAPAPANPFVLGTETGQYLRGLREMRYMDVQTLDQRPASFMRLVVTRRGVSASSPGIEPFSFTPQPAVLANGAVRSNAIVLRGFSGSVVANIPAGAVLFVNGVAQAGSSATVKAGDTLWLETTAPAIDGVPRNYTLSLGGYSAMWTFTTTPPAAVPDHAGTASGYTPVETGVSESGAAQASIPIVVSPGTAGMQPKLAINYSSQGGNGPLGIGFSLTGLSAISRAGATIAQDGFKGSVAFNANDRFTFDGQRLIVINGVDGADGAEYRLEFDPSVRIRSHGTEGASGPQRWIVETKAGLTLQLGGTADSRVQCEGSSTPLAWAVDRITDSVGNEMVFNYDNVARQRGEMLLEKIAYTSNPAAGLTASQEVVCEYENRPDARTSYLVGFSNSSLKRLKAIESRATSGGSMQRVRRYTLSYQQAEINGFSQLTQVQEMTSSGTLLSPTMFTWATDSGADQTVSTSIGIPLVPPFDISPPAPVMGGDFNGDGLMDMFKMNDHPGTRQPGDHWIALGNNSGVFDYSTPVGDFQNKGLSDSREEGSRLRTCDLNGDGKTDVFHLYYVNGINNFAGIARGDGTFSLIEGSQLGDLATLGFRGGSLSEFLLIDINGDGRSDAVYIEIGKHFVALGNGDGSFTKVANIGGLTTANYGSTVSGGGGSWILPGDYNGDGRADLLHLYYSNGVNNWLGLSVGDGSFDVRLQNSIPGMPPDSFNNTNTHYVTADFNGDGLTDVLCLKSGLNQNGWLAISKGDGSFQRITNVTGINGAPTGNLSTSKFTAGDFNGDGLTDVFHASTTAADAWIAFSKGDGTFERRSSTALGDLAGKTYSSGISSKVFAGDYDGDGAEDILHLQYNGLNYLARSTGFDRSMMTKVVNGHGGFTTFGYQAMTEAGVHQKGGGLIYPYYDLQAPMQVVNSMKSRNGIDVDAFTGNPFANLGENEVTYRYEGAWASLDGRGYQGFKAVETTDLTSRIVTRTEYESSSPLLAGRPKRMVQQLMPDKVPPGGSATISESLVTWHQKDPANPSDPKTYLITEASSVTKSYETNRPAATALIKTTTRSGPESNGGRLLYDAYGNLLESLSTTTDGTETFTERVVNTYADAPTPAKWHLGRLSASTVTKTAPGGETSSRSSSFQYHAVTGLLTREVIEPGGGVLRQQKDYVHDDFGNIATSTLSTPNELARTTTTHYTTDGRFVRETRNAKNHAENKTYDPLLGNVLSQTGPNGLTTTWIYDFLGRPVLEQRPDGTQTRSFYRLVTGATTGAPPRAVHYVRVQSSGGSPKTVWYDLLDREFRTDGIAFDGRTVYSQKVFNTRGEVTHASQPFFAGETPRYSLMEYDAVGRETKQTDPGSRIITTVHDGLTTYVTNPKSQTVSTAVNAMGWTVRTTDAENKSIVRRYEAYGLLRFVTDPASNVTELRYDARGNKTWMSEPNSGISEFTYNGYGELLWQKNAAGEEVDLDYDLLGRVILRSEDEGDTAFEFDTAARGIGQLARESSGEFERVCYYDTIGRLAATVERHGYHKFAISRGYDPIGRPALLTYPSGFAVRQVYNGFGHLLSVLDAGNPNRLYWSALMVNARGQVTREVQGNGVVTERVFDDETGLIDAILASFNTTGDVQRLEYDFDAIGNLAARRDERFTATFEETFAYDPLNRLTGVTTTGAPAVTVGYNDIGNISFRSDVGTFNYGSGGAGPHALTSVTGGAFDKACAYNAKGERVADGGTSIDYSSFGKPVRMRKGGDTLRFEYATDRALYRQTIFSSDSSGAPVQSVREYVGGLYERETTSGGSVKHTHYIAGGSGVVAIHTDDRAAAATSQHTRYVHKDHLGSVDVITDSAGAEVERQSFDAWGRRRTVTHASGTWQVSYPTAPPASGTGSASAETHRGFTGHEMLDAVGLVHMGGRVYDPLTARFLSPDPFVQSPENLQNLNRYSYVLNNPLSFTDPSGFFFKAIGKFFQKHWKTIVSIGIGVATGMLFAPAGALINSALGVAWGGAAAAGAGFGFGSAFSGTLLAGGSVGDALRAGIVSGAITGLSAGLTKGISTQLGLHDLKPTDAGFAETLAKKVVVHGTVQGGISEMQGGKFIHGFAAGATSAFSSPFIANSVPEGFQTVVAAISGGTGSVLGGGKFENGAVSGAFVYLFNQIGAQKQHTVGVSAGGNVAIPFGPGGKVGLAVSFEDGFPYITDVGVYGKLSINFGLAFNGDVAADYAGGSFRDSLGLSASGTVGVGPVSGSYTMSDSGPGMELSAGLGTGLPVSAYASMNYSFGLSMRAAIGGVVYTGLRATGNFDRQDLDHAFIQYLMK